MKRPFLYCLYLFITVGSMSCGAGTKKRATDTPGQNSTEATAETNNESGVGTETNQGLENSEVDSAQAAQNDQ